jgi:lysophospholipid acyltransferase (LPLAT)-like uncharacterized protein
MSNIFLFLEKWFAYLFLSMLRLTLRYERKGLEFTKDRVIYVFWHRNIIPLLIDRRNENNVVIISSSRDGDYIAEPAKLFGYKVVRGSSTRGGMKALTEMVRLSKEHSLALTPDGPKGPVYNIKEGALQLSYLSGLPIVAVKVNVKSAFIFNSWDKFILPKPFSKIYLEYSNHYYIKTKDDFRLKIDLEEFLLK